MAIFSFKKRLCFILLQVLFLVLQPSHYTKTPLGEKKFLFKLYSIFITQTRLQYLNIYPVFQSYLNNFSFDLRHLKAESQGKIWASESNSEVARAQLHIHSEPTAVLALHGVTQDDAGTYRCRVDFKRSPTRYRKITLHVIGIHFCICQNSVRWLANFPTNQPILIDNSHICINEIHLDPKLKKKLSNPQNLQII